MEGKSVSYRITVAQMAPHVHSFLAGENKVEKISKWLINWIKLSLECGKIKPFDLLPSKADLACHIGVSQGTVQNAYRMVEDAGFIESKQRVGSYIKDMRKTSGVEKLTSKREQTIEVLKRYFIENGYRIGDLLPSNRKLAQDLGFSNTTVRLAITKLAQDGIVEKDGNGFRIITTEFSVKNVENKTLVEKIAESLRLYIKKNYKPGEILPPNSELVCMFKVSIKTIHDAIKLLAKDGLVYTRRGRYGTVVLDETLANDLEMYSYEKIEQKIRQYMIENSKPGDKLPAIRVFSKMFNTSEKTVKKALDNLSEDGYIMFSRGRYGGTFVLDIPESSNEAYKWLAINAEYMPEMGKGLN